MPTEPTEPTPARPGAAAVAPALRQPHPRPRARTNPGHSADSAATWFGASLLLFFLTLVVPVAVMGQNFGPLGRVSTLLALFVTWYAALRLAGHYRTGRPHLVQITFWAFVYLFMGLASFAELTADLNATRLRVDDTVAWTADTVGAAAGLVLGIGAPR